MQQDAFGDAAIEALKFGGSLVGSLNMTSILMHILVAKGVLERSEAQWIVEEAARSTANIELPEPWASGIASTFARVRQTFE